MTTSMLFRGFGATASPTITTAAPALANANVLYKSRAAAVVFIGSLFFTAFYVMVTLISRNQADKTAFKVALPSSIALYFANVATTVCAGGYNNPIVALILILQNKKYAIYSLTTTVSSAYEWSMIFGSIAGGIFAGLICIYLDYVLKKIKEDEGS